MKVQRDVLKAFLRINWSDVEKTLALEDGTMGGGLSHHFFTVLMDDGDKKPAAIPQSGVRG